MSQTERSASLAPIVVSRWPTEIPLLVLTAVIAAILWLVLIVSVVGILYVGVLALFFFVIRLAFIGYLRGSAVRLGPNQFPELYGAIDSLARRMQMRTPEAYLMQAGGDLNAFATRFVRANIIVLYSDLLEACGDSTAARDMIIAHELGHLKCGHVRWHWFLLPALFIPFLGTALSRAREYTCDRFGLAGAGDKDGATLGLTILASGGAYAQQVNREQLVRQKETVTGSGLMTLAEWFGTHPPLSRRIGRLDPALARASRDFVTGPVMAGAIVLAVPLSIIALVMSISGSEFAAKIRDAMNQGAVAGEQQGLDSVYVAPPDAAERARADIARIAAFVHEERNRGSLPWNLTDLKERMALGFRAEFPVDPFDGNDYGYDHRGEQFVVWSSGADQKSWTADDIRYDSRAGRIVSDTVPRR